MDADDKNLSYIPLDRVTATQGLVQALHDRWWSVHPERGVVIYRRFSPQCNMNEAISRKLTEKMYPWADVRQIPLVLVPINPRDY